MRALIVGASGQIGKRIAQVCQSRNISYVGTGRTRHAQTGLRLEMSDREMVRRVVSEQSPDVIFICAALAAVDYCETHPDEARRINVEGVRNIADAARALNSTVVYLSTDYVFDGRGGPYRESDPVSPQSVYARTKWEGEQVLLDYAHAIVARTAVVYEWDPESVNFVMQMIKRLSEKQPTRVVSDQWSHPTLARNLAEVLVELVQKKASGVFHLVGPDYVSRFDFTMKLAQIFGFDTSLLQPMLTADANQPAHRPLQSDLIAEKLGSVAQTRMIGIQQGLELVFADFKAARKPAHN